MSKRVKRWTYLILISIALLSCIPLYFKLYYTSKEPFFLSPVKDSIDGRFHIRNDAMGEGYFNASRKPNRLHMGLDLEGGIETQILAAKSGRVIYAEENGGYGKHIRVRHPNGFETRYAHLSLMHVTKGVWVNQGESIGVMGKSGNAGSKRMGTHVHFELRKRGIALDPLHFMT